MICSDPATSSAWALPCAPTPASRPIAGSVGDYYWGGAGGTYFWVDPKEKMFVVYMMQSPSKRAQYRILLRNMVYAAITE